MSRSGNRTPRCLYISYEGALEPLGQSQVVPYVVGLSARGRSMVLMTFEKRRWWAQEPLRAQTGRRLREAGVVWIPLGYHQRPRVLSTVWDMAAGVVVGMAVIVRHRVRLVHVRSFVPAGIGYWLKRCLRVKLLFDMRGFWVEERVEAKLWPQDGWLYRLAKRCERAFLREADAVVTLTEASRSEIGRLVPRESRRVPLGVIPKIGRAHV